LEDLDGGFRVWKKTRDQAISGDEYYFLKKSSN